MEVIVEFEAEAFSTEAGEGVADCGATPSCMGDETWEAWLAAMGKTADDLEFIDVDKVFKFGGGERLTSKTMVKRPIAVRGHARILEVYLVTGATPLLIARPVLEERGVVIDFRTHKMMLSDHPEDGWSKMRQNHKGRLMLDLLDAPTGPRAKTEEVLAASDGDSEDDLPSLAAEESSGDEGQPGHVPADSDDEEDSDEDYDDVFMLWPTEFSPEHS